MTTMAAIESNRDGNKDDDSEGVAEDGNIDMETHGNTWEGVLRKIWRVTSTPKEEAETAGKVLTVVF